MSSYRDCPNNAVMTLIKTFSAARHTGDVGDLEHLLGALRLLRPDWVQWDVYEAWLYIRHRNWMEALRLLQQVNSCSNLPVCTALLACCLYAVEDTTWHSYAMQALEQQVDPEAARIATRLIKLAESKQGIKGSMASIY